MSEEILRPTVCTLEDWLTLDDTQKQFLRDAEDGYFRYQVEDGRVLAWGAPRTENLFSMEVKETEGDDESVYTLVGEKYE